MNGIQVSRPGEARVVELARPERREGYAIVKVMAASICGTDVSTFRGQNVNVSSYPIIIGHETAGIVEDVDESNEYGIKKGDHVVLDPYLYCGHCYPCSQGKTNCCETCIHLNYAPVLELNPIKTAQLALFYSVDMRKGRLPHIRQAALHL